MRQEADFDYILTTVLGQKADSPIRKSLSRAGIDNLKYKDSTLGKAFLIELPDGYMQCLICFKA